MKIHEAAFWAVAQCGAASIFRLKMDTQRSPEILAPYDIIHTMSQPRSPRHKIKTRPTIFGEDNQYRVYQH